MRSLLLHVCCGPCSTEVIERLRGGHELTLLFYNPNIFPREEHDRRLAEAEKYAASKGLPLVRGEWDHGEWLEAVRGMEAEPEGGRRCERCFETRLRAAARVARLLGAELFTTTLTVSPHKRATLVNAVGERVAREEALRSAQDGSGRGLARAAEPAFLSADFKKGDGFLRSCRLASEAGMHRQDYCGCEFSLRAREERRRGRPGGADAQKRERGAQAGR
ncbi:MAG: epoxyqueuosine reductase QueH [Thermoplasmatota archaeon]